LYNGDGRKEGLFQEIQGTWVRNGGAACAGKATNTQDIAVAILGFQA